MNDDKKIAERAKKVETIVGIPYKEYEKLDIDEQHKLIEKKNGKKFKYDTRTYIDGVLVEEEHNFIFKEANDCFDKLKYESKKLLKKLFKK